MIAFLSSAFVIAKLSGPGVSVTLEVPDYRMEDQKPRHRVLANMAGCYVLIRNETNHPIQVLGDLNSLGDSAMSYEAIGPGGKRITLSGMGEAYSKNFPAAVRLAPGEVSVRPFRLRQGEMKRLADLGRRVTVRAMFTQDESARKAMRSSEIWVGVSISPPVVVDVSN